MLSRPLLFLVFLVLTVSKAQAQRMIYSQVAVSLSAKHTMAQLAALGVETDHGRFYGPRVFSTILSTAELERVMAAGFKTKILVKDAVADFTARNNRQLQAMATYRPGPIGPRIAAQPDTQTFCLPNMPQRVPAHWHLGTMGGHMKYEEVLAQLDSMHLLYPNLITQRKSIVDTIRTFENRPIEFLRLSNDTAAPDTAEPHILYTAVHHAREPVSVHQMLYFMWYMLENYATDSSIRAMVDNAQIFFVPFVNPDGYVYNQTNNPAGGGLWRKNRRPHSNGIDFGIDPNRNYGQGWGVDDFGSSPNPASDVFRGTAPFSEPETRAIRALAFRHRFLLALNYHTFSSVIVTAYGYQNLRTPDSTHIRALARAMTKENGYAYGTTLEVLGYLANGGADDYLYTPIPGKPKMLSYTPEVGTTGFWPTVDEILPLCAENLFQNLVALRAVFPYVQFNDTTGLFLRPGLSPNPGPPQLRYTLKRIGANAKQGASFAITFNPFGPNAAGLSAVSRTHSNLPLGGIIGDSIPLPAAAIDANNQATRVGWRVTISNGIFSQSDTVYHYSGAAQVPAGYADAAESLTGWSTAGFERHTYRPFQGAASLAYITRDTSTLWPAILTRIRPFDLNRQGWVGAELSFFIKHRIDPFNNLAAVQLSTDSGANWFTVCTQGTHKSSEAFGQETVGVIVRDPVWDGQRPGWSKQTIDLSPYLPKAGRRGKKVWLRFVANNNYVRFNAQPFAKDTFAIDDIHVQHVENLTSVPDRVMTHEGLYALPNPALSILTIESNLPGDMALINAEGRVVKTVQYEKVDHKQPVDLRDLPGGLYLLRQGGRFLRVVKQ